ncbi:hypothetical protein AMC78_CH02535 [Rhizobium phaseoli]|uniref:hypothetical protein n=1 Tax=Rhizobium phaseoli TaxID=396 RepID=UPI0007EC2CAD|nr:hypothetical protein [Rhizobium phaseoli]ANM04622.1 hypothetical protein AMC78_CH02535 [Rhizobium phaseoli]
MQQETELPGYQYFVERAKRTGSIFALPVDLLPGEDIRAAALRAAHRNAFLNTRTVIDLTRSRSFRSLSSIHGNAAFDELDKLIDVLGLRKDAEHVRWLLCSERNQSRDWTRVNGLKVRRGDIVSERRVAPRSLKKNGCQKAVWALRSFAFDLATTELLLDHCLACQMKLGWGRSNGIFSCDKCKADLREFPQEFINIGDHQSLGFVAAIVDPYAAGESHPLHPDIASLDRGELYQLIVKIGRVLGNRRWRDGLDTGIIEQAGRAVMGWPKAYDDMLDRVGEDRCLDALSHPFDALHNDVNLSNRIRRLLRERTEARLRRTAIGQTNRAEVQSTIVPVPLDPARGDLAQLKRLAITAVGTPVEVAIGLLRRSDRHRRMAFTLGIPIPWLVDLFLAGLLPDIAEVVEGVLVKPKKVVPVSVLEILGNATHNERLAFPIGLRSAIFSLSHYNGSKCAGLLQAVCEGSLRVRAFGDPATSILARLAIANDEILNVVARTPTTLSPTDRVPLTQNDAALALGKARTVVGALVSKGFLSSHPTVDDIFALRRHWMFLSEVLDLAYMGGKMDLGNIRYSLMRSEIAREPIGDITLWSRLGVRELFATERLEINRDFG